MTTYQTALRQLMNKPFLRTPKYREQQTRARREGANPLLLEFEAALVNDFKRRGIPMFAHNIVRTADEQDALFRQGVTNAKGHRSPHNYGMAVDVIHSVKAWGLDRRSWAIIGHVGNEVAARLGIDIRWGGDWNDNGVPVWLDRQESLWDPAHWELADWRTLAGV